MDLQHTIESLKYQFNEADYTRKRDIHFMRHKALPQKKMKDQTHDYAIIEYDGKNPVYSLWFASYMSENNFPVERVEEIRLIGEPGKDSLEKLQNAFPKAKIVVINKEIKELEFEDLYCEHTLVFHFFGDLFLKEKAYKVEISIKSPNFPMQDTVLTTVPRRYNLERLAKLIRDTRFIYNIFAYNCEGDDMDWQMLKILEILNPDTRMSANSHSKTYVCGNLCINSLSWNEDDSLRLVKPIIAFEDKKFNPDIEFFYDKPLKYTKYLDGLYKKTDKQILSRDWFISEYELSDDDLFSQPIMIASEFIIDKLCELFKYNNKLCDEIMERYLEASSDGVFGANNNLGVFYAYTNQYDKAKRYFNKAILEGDEKALVNLYVLSKIEKKPLDSENIKKKLGEIKSQCFVWNKAMELWEKGHFIQAICLFEILSKEEDDKYQADGKGLCQMAINNLIKIYSEGKPEAGIKVNYPKVQKLLEKVKYNENKELIALCIHNNFLTVGCPSMVETNESEAYDNSISFSIIKELYDNNIHESSRTYNMAVYYALGIGCEKDCKKAIDICDEYLNEHDDNEINRLKAYILLKNGNEQKFREIIENLEVAEFKDKVNATKTYEGEEFKKRMLELENVRGCVKCNRERKYNEKLRVCPVVLTCIGFAYYKEGDKEKGNAYFERAAEFGDPSACFLVANYLKKKGDIDKAISMYRKAMYYGHRRSLVFLHEYEKNIVAKLHYLLLIEGSNFMEDGKIQYLVYKILSHGCISIDIGDEYVWLLKSSDNEYADAIITYINELIDEGDEYAALEYLRKYKGNDDNVKKKLAELEEKFEVDDDDYDDDYYDDYYEGGGYEWTDEDAWDAMTDGQYGDYPGPGWDPERFGY